MCVCVCVCVCCVVSILKLKPASNSAYDIYLYILYSISWIITIRRVKYDKFVCYLHWYGNGVLSVYLHTQLHLRFHSRQSTDTISLIPFPFKFQLRKINADVDSSYCVMSTN